MQSFPNLWVVQKRILLIDAHVSRIWADNNNSGSNNRKYKGATFYFTLPVVYMNGQRRGGEEERLVNDQLQ